MSLWLPGCLVLHLPTVGSVQTYRNFQEVLLLANRTMFLSLEVPKLVQWNSIHVVSCFCELQSAVCVLILWLGFELLQSHNMSYFISSTEMFSVNNVHLVKSWCWRHIIFFSNITNFVSMGTSLSQRFMYGMFVGRWHSGRWLKTKGSRNKMDIFGLQGLESASFLPYGFL